MDRLQPQARPILKWAGGKRRLLPELLKRMPHTFNRYFEPFFGGGALFFHLRPRKAVLGDLNEELIHLYKTVRDHPDTLIKVLENYVYDKDFFYRLRALVPSELNGIERAARIIYLNRTCFNGLYRVNRKGHFNVPFGSYKNPLICDADNIRTASERLRGSRIRYADFRKTVESAKKGDFVYFDPPYIPLSPTASFVSYVGKGFTMEDHSFLAETARKLQERGVYCMISNSASPLSKKLYERKEFQVKKVFAARAISAGVAGRAPVKEYIITNY